MVALQPVYKTFYAKIFYIYGKEILLLFWPYDLSQREIE